LKLYERDLFQGYLELNPWIAGGVVFGVVLTGYIVGLLDFVLHARHQGRHGVTWFWTTTFGDPILLPITVGLIAWFYQRTSVEENNWLVSSWTSLGCFLAALGATGIFITMRATLNHKPTLYELKDGGDWTTTADGGLNYYGWVHSIFFWLIAYFWLEFAVKGLAYLIKEGFPADLTVVYFGVIGVIAFFMFVLGNLDNRVESPLHWVLKQRGWNF
jgi:hypothetical protein